MRRLINYWKFPAILVLGVGIVVFFTVYAAQSPQILVNGVQMTGAQIAQGQQIYTQYCAACHGANGEGQFPQSPNQPDATGRYGAPPHDETGHTWHHGDGLLVRYIREGGISLTDPENWYPMPGFGAQLTDEQIVSVIGYIKTMWTDEQRTRQQLVTENENAG